MISSPIVAVVTPFDAAGGLDFVALGDYLDLLGAAGVQTILVNGTTGEFANMTAHERRVVLEYCRANWSRQIVAHVGGTAIGEVVELARHAQEYANVVAVLAPYYFAEPSEAGVGEFFRQVLRASQVPVMLYNFPRHTQTVIDPRLVARLAGEFPVLHGLKDSGGDLAVTRAYKTLRPELRIFVGDDRVGARLAELGIDGVVTGAGGPVAELAVGIATAVRRGDRDRAEDLQRHFDRYTDARKAMPLADIAYAKAALGARLPGFPPFVRPPLVTSTPEQRARIGEFMREEMESALG
ncbi:dihydrodipicolinate synthase family protein [Nocardia sp. NPDC052566]|uniref:dihydrodipicolinate synthase family protein n=1 Tax=Nocardia sp. NPDC052566 TaxID=3364330 RepID=UPI0037C59E1F